MDVGVAMFAGVDGAERAFADARDRDPGAAWLGDAALVEVHRSGRIVIRGTVAGTYVDIDGIGDAIGDDTAAGAIVGAAYGFLLGPPAFAVGLVGGTVAGGVAEARQIPRAEGPAFDAIRERMPEGSSAVVVVSAPGDVRAMWDALIAAADEFTRYRLSAAAEADLRSELAQAPAATPRPAD